MDQETEIIWNTYIPIVSHRVLMKPFAYQLISYSNHMLQLVGAFAFTSLIIEIYLEIRNFYF